MRRFVPLALSLLATGQAAAFTPESGFWWNPAEAGRGFNIEIQDNYLFLAAYVYDNNNAPTWFTAQGTMRVTDLTNNLAVYTGALDRTTGGQCVGSASACPYRVPTTTAAAGGNFRIDFQSETRAVLTWAGGTTAIQRFDYSLTPPGGDPKTDALLGQWQLVLDYSSILTTGYPLYGENLIFDRRSQDSTEKYFDGCRSLSTSVRSCTATLITNNGASGFHFTETVAGVTKDRLLIAVRDDAQEFLIYYMDYGTYQLNGIVKNCPSTIPASQRYSQCIRSDTYRALPVRGLRTRSRSFVNGDNTSPSNTAPDSKAYAVSAGLPSFGTNASGGLSNVQARDDLQLDVSEIPEDAFTELMQRMDRN